jgi:hypothetical protein
MITEVEQKARAYKGSASLLPQQLGVFIFLYDFFERETEGQC